MTASRALTSPATDPMVARLASDGLRRSEAVIDFQVDLEELERETLSSRLALAREVEEDLADDRRRFVRYQDVEHAIRHGDRDAQLAAFHLLVAHVERDERLEDERRLKRPAALLLHAMRLRELRRIFRVDFVPLITGRAEQ